MAEVMKIGDAGNDLSGEEQACGPPNIARFHVESHDFLNFD